MSDDFNDRAAKAASAMHRIRGISTEVTEAAAIFNQTYDCWRTKMVRLVEARKDIEEAAKCAEQAANNPVGNPLSLHVKLEAERHKRGFYTAELEAIEKREKQAFSLVEPSWRNFMLACSNAANDVLKVDWYPAIPIEDEKGD